MTRIEAARSGLLALLLASGGCGGTLAVATVGRVDSAVWGREAQPSAVQLAPTAAWRPRPGGLAAGVTYTPTLRLESGSPALARHRLGAEVGSARAAGLRPYGRLDLDYGTVRPGDLATGDVLEPQPGLDLLSSYGVRAEGGLRRRMSRRTEFQVGASGDRSAGIGASASTLPPLTRTQLFARAQHRPTRTQTWDGAVRVSRYVMDTSSLLVEADARATVRPSQRLSLAATAGAAVAKSDGDAATRPLAALAAAYDRPGGLGARLSVATRPDFDRLDGGLRQRLLVQAALSAQPWRAVRLGSAVSWAADLAGPEAQRSTLIAEGTVGVRIARDWDAVFGARAFLQGGALAPGAKDPSEARLQIGLSRRLDLR